MTKLARISTAVAVVAVLAVPALAQSTKERVEALDGRVASMEKQLAEKLTALDQRLASLSAIEARLTALEQQLAKPQAQGGNPNATRATIQPASSEDEQAARQLFDEVNQLVGAGNAAAAQAKLNTLTTTYPNTSAARAAQRLQSEFAVLGKAAPQDYGIEKWLQGEQDIDLKSTKTTLIVFWEIWCPHCRREVPKIQQLYTLFKDKGLQVVGLTKLSRSSTEESLMSFLKENGLTYPIAKENGLASGYFGVQGVPAAAVVKDGKVVWRGHPARITEEVVKNWL